MELEKSKVKESLLYPVAVIVVVIGMQIYASLTQGELFPFAPFKMYSFGYSGEDLTMVRIFCQDFNGTERLLSNYRLLKVESYYSTDIENILGDSEKPSDEAIRKIKELTSGLVRETQDRCQKLKVYKMHWDQFTGPVRDQPKTKELLLEL